MPSRVMLLLMFTGLFMAAWSTDHPGDPGRRPAVVVLDRPFPAAELAIMFPVGKQNHDKIDRPGGHMHRPRIVVTSIETIGTPSVDEFADFDCLVVETSSSVTQAERSGGDTALTVAGRLDGSDEIPLNDLWMFAGCNVRLPDGITPGDYRIVSSSGQVQSLVLSAGDIIDRGARGGTVDRELYMLDDGSCRLYFVRVMGIEGLKD